MRKRLKNNGKLSARIRKTLEMVQQILNKDLLKELGTPKMSALTTCKERLQKARLYAKSYERLKVLSNDRKIQSQNRKV